MIRGSTLAAALVAAAVALRCGSRTASPSKLDTRNDACTFCRMPVSDPRLAAQLAAPSEETRFFDDLGCLRSYLEAGGSLPARAIAYVADHETGRWVAASAARYERCPGIETPMGSHLIAHSGSGAGGAGCEPITAAALFGARGAPSGAPR